MEQIDKASLFPYTLRWSQPAALEGEAPVGYYMFAFEAVAGETVEMKVAASQRELVVNERDVPNLPRYGSIDVKAYAVSGCGARSVPADPKYPICDNKNESPSPRLVKVTPTGKGVKGQEGHSDIIRFEWEPTTPEREGELYKLSWYT